MLINWKTRCRKSSLILRYVDNTFSDLYTQLGVDFKYRIINMYNYNMKIRIWDTTAVDRFRTVTPHYYRNANIIYVIYDTTDLNSCNEISKWIDHIETHTIYHKTYNEKKFLQIGVIGTKLDKLKTIEDQSWLKDFQHIVNINNVIELYKQRN